MHYFILILSLLCMNLELILHVYLYVLIHTSRPITLQQSQLLHPLFLKNFFMAIIFEMLSMSLNSQEFMSHSVTCPHRWDLGMVFVILNWTW